MAIGTALRVPLIEDSRLFQSSFTAIRSVPPEILP